MAARAALLWLAAWVAVWSAAILSAPYAPGWIEALGREWRAVL